MKDFLSAAAAMIFAVSLSLLSKDVREFAASHSVYAGFGIILCLIAIFLFTLWRHEKIKIGENSLPVRSDDLQSQIRVQFSDTSMSKSLEEIYDRYFKNKHAMSDEEYRKIEDRRKFVRIAIKTYENRIDRIAVGYYSIFPISFDLFKKLSNGDFKEANITSEHVLDPDHDGAAVLYICEICCTDEKAAIKLIMDMKKYVKDLSAKNKNIKHVGAWGFSKDGRRLIELMGMKKVPSFSKRKPYYILDVESEAGGKLD